MKRFVGFEKGMGIGGWLTNYKRFNVLPMEWRFPITVGDMEHFESYITRRDVDYIKSLGLDHIRMGFDQVVVEESAGVYRERIFEIIERFIGWCRDAGLNLVLNMHKAIGNYCDIKEDVQLLDSEELQERFIAVWLEFEKRFHGYPEVAFELLNEVRNVDPEKWNVLAKKAIAEIRKLNPNRLIIIGSTCWNSSHTIKDLTGYDDDIVFTWHNYAPNEFTHQRGVLQAPQLYYNRDMPYPCDDIERYRDFQRVVHGAKNPYPNYTRMDIQFLRDYLAPVFQYQAEHPERIVWCGEFGTIRHAKIEWREAYMADMIRLLIEHETPYCVWNYLSTPNDGNRFSLVDDDRREILSKRLAEIIVGKV